MIEVEVEVEEEVEVEIVLVVIVIGVVVVVVGLGVGVCGRPRRAGVIPCPSHPPRNHCWLVQASGRCVLRGSRYAVRKEV